MYYISKGHPFQLIIENKRPFFRFDATGTAELEDYQLNKLQIAKLEQRGFKVSREKAEVKVEEIKQEKPKTEVKVEEPVKSERETDKLITRKDCIEYMKRKEIKIPNINKLNVESLINELKKMEI